MGVVDFPMMRFITHWRKDEARALQFSLLVTAFEQTAQVPGRTRPSCILEIVGGKIFSEFWEDHRKDISQLQPALVF